MAGHESRLIDGILRLRAERSERERDATPWYCHYCGCVREFERAFRAGELGGGVVITHIEAGWECVRCRSGCGFFFFIEKQWRWMCSVGMAWRMTAAEAKCWGVETQDL